MNNQLQKDFIAFVDGDCIVPYFVEDAKYIVKPIDFHERFEYQFKFYYRYFSDYCVGIDCSNFARPIYKDEFIKVKTLFEVRNEARNVSISKKMQLSFDFC